MKPRVSVVIPAYNCAAYIGEAIESALEQTYRDFEIIVVDDGCTDGTWKVVGRYRDRVTAIRQDHRGVSAARNEALRHARGEFIALLDGDDTYFPEKLELQVRVMEENPEAALVFADLVLVSASGTPLGTTFSPHRVFREWIMAHGRGPVAAGWIYREMLIQMCTPGSTALLRRRCLDTVGYYDPALGAGAEDYELYLRLAQRFPIVCLDRTLYKYRWHEASSSGPFATRIDRWMELHRQVRRAHFCNLPEDLPQESWAALSQYYWAALALDRLEEARLLFRPCLRHQQHKAKAALFYLGSYLPAPGLRAVRSVRQAMRRTRPAPAPEEVRPA